MSDKMVECLFEACDGEAYCLTHAMVHSNHLLPANIEIGVRYSVMMQTDKNGNIEYFSMQKQEVDDDQAST